MIGYIVGRKSIIDGLIRTEFYHGDGMKPRWIANSRTASRWSFDDEGRAGAQRICDQWADEGELTAVYALDDGLVRAAERQREGESPSRRRF